MEEVMILTNGKTYLIDDESVTPTQLIMRAGKLDTKFANSWIKQTSVAAFILRRNGHKVGENKTQEE